MTERLLLAYIVEKHAVSGEFLCASSSFGCVLRCYLVMIDRARGEWVVKLA